jgi:hypothetical protein
MRPRECGKCCEWFDTEDPGYCLDDFDGPEVLCKECAMKHVTRALQNEVDLLVATGDIWLLQRAAHELATTR